MGKYMVLTAWHPNVQSVRTRLQGAAKEQLQLHFNITASNGAGAFAKVKAATTMTLALATRQSDTQRCIAMFQSWRNYTEVASLHNRTFNWRIHGPDGFGWGDSVCITELKNIRLPKANKYFDWSSGDRVEVSRTCTTAGRNETTRSTESMKDTTRTPNADEVKVLTANPTIAYKFVKVIDGQYYSMNVRPSSTSSAMLKYTLGMVTVSPSGTDGIHCYSSKERALQGLPFYDAKYRAPHKAALLKVAVVGTGMGFYKERAHMPQFSAVIPLEEVWREAVAPKAEPKFENREVEVTNSCTWSMSGGQPNGGAMYGVIKHGSTHVACVVHEGVKLCNTTPYTLKSTGSGWGPSKTNIRVFKTERVQVA